MPVYRVVSHVTFGAGLKRTVVAEDEDEARFQVAQWAYDNKHALIKNSAVNGVRHYEVTELPQEQAHGG